MEFKGVDVSELQGNINWKNVESTGMKFAMIKATYGSSGTDGQFISNMQGISQTSISPGAYHQSSAQSVSEAVAEANHFLSVIRPYNFHYPLALRMESEIAIETGKFFFTNIISSFLNVVKEAQYWPMLYATLYNINNHIDINRVPDVDIWLGDLTSDLATGPAYNENVTIWQHSCRGSVRGISGNTNLNISYVDYPKIITEKGWNHLQTDISNNGENNFNMRPNNLEPDFSEPSFYTVEKDDTLRNIAKKIFGDPEQYKRIMELNGLTRPIIFAGQTLRIPKNINSDMILYRINPGDTLWKIAERFLGRGQRYEEIMRINGLTTDMIYPGQILKIPVEQEIFMQTYTVKEGDTLWKIAQIFLDNGNRYNEIIALNNLNNGNLRVGQSLKIPMK